MGAVAPRILPLPRDGCTPPPNRETLRPSTNSGDAIGKVSGFERIPRLRGFGWSERRHKVTPALRFSWAIADGRFELLEVTAALSASLVEQRVSPIVAEW
jgi:hypothetical protein